jgi:glycosyltransferase involved in cell wall biosynthesis
VIHCHQYHTLVTNLAILYARLTGKKIYVSDHGGGGGFDLSYHIDLGKLVTGYLMISEYTARSYRKYQDRSQVEVVYGGVDAERFRPQAVPRERKVLYVGRLLALKGVNVLVEAVDPETKLVIIGRKYDEPFFQLLQELAQGKNVEFLTDASEERIIQEYCSAAVTVLPTVKRDVYGNEVITGGEIFGLVLVESMACETPVICTNTGGMPEIVEDGVTGFIVPPSDPQPLREKIRWMLDHPEEARRMGRRGRAVVLERFTWQAVAERCLAAYRYNSVPLK